MRTKRWRRGPAERLGGGWSLEQAGVLHTSMATRPLESRKVARELTLRKSGSRNADTRRKPGRTYGTEDTL